MPSGVITDPHIILAILVLAGATVILIGPACANMAEARRRERRKG